MMNMEFSFIVIDDSELDCFLARKVIELTDKCLITRTFQNAQHALDAIGENPIGRGKHPIIILLDIQMPELNGFQFVEEFEKFPLEVKENYIIIILSILSSERNRNDIYRLLTNGTVNSIIEKPLTREKLFSFLKQIKPTI
jgi:CheY-like chemotaxis protein